jgi:hypothetical protein
LRETGDFEMSNWDLSGLNVHGIYLDDIPVFGKIESSRVKYGGGIQHTVVLKEPINVYGALRDRVLLDHSAITRVSNN